MRNIAFFFTFSFFVLTFSYGHSKGGYSYYCNVIKTMGACFEITVKNAMDPIQAKIFARMYCFNMGGKLMDNKCPTKDLIGMCIVENSEGGKFVGYMYKNIYPTKKEAKHFCEVNNKGKFISK